MVHSMRRPVRTSSMWSSSDRWPADIGPGAITVKEMLLYVPDRRLDNGFILEQGRRGFADSTDAARANLDYMRRILES
jgi:hypothetical protein